MSEVWLPGGTKLVPRMQRIAQVSPVQHYHRATGVQSPELMPREHAMQQATRLLQQFNKPPREIYPTLKAAIDRCRTFFCNPSEIEHVAVEAEKILQKWRRSAYQAVEDSSNMFDVEALAYALDDLEKSLTFPSPSDGEEVIANDQTLRRGREKLEDWLDNPEIISQKMRRKAHEAYLNKVLSIVKNMHPGDAHVITSVRQQLTGLFEINEQWPKERHFERLLHELLEERVFRSANMGVKMFCSAVNQQADSKRRTKQSIPVVPKAGNVRAAAKFFAKRLSLRAPTQEVGTTDASTERQSPERPSFPSSPSDEGKSRKSTQDSVETKTTDDSRTSVGSCIYGLEQPDPITTRALHLYTPSFFDSTQPGIESYQMSPASNHRMKPISNLDAKQRATTSHAPSDTDDMYDWSGSMEFLESQETVRRFVFCEDEEDAAASSAYFEETPAGKQDEDVKNAFRLVLGDNESSWREFLALGLPKNVIAQLKNKGGSTLLEVVEVRKKAFSSKMLQELYYGPMKKHSICKVEEGDYVWYSSKSNVNSIMAKVQEVLGDRVRVLDLDSGESLVVDRAWVDKTSLQVDQ